VRAVCFGFVVERIRSIVDRAQRRHGTPGYTLPVTDPSSPSVRETKNSSFRELKEEFCDRYFFWPSPMGEFMGGGPSPGCLTAILFGS